MHQSSPVQFASACAQPWRFLVVFAAIVGGCAPDGGEGVLDLQQSVGQGSEESSTDAGTPSSGTHCDIRTSDSVGIELVRLAGNTAQLRVLNLHDAAAQVTVVGTSFGDGGPVQTRPLSVALGSKSSTAVLVRLTPEEVANRVDVRGGRIQFTAIAAFEDGTRYSSTTPHAYYVLRDGEGLTLSSGYPFRDEDLTVRGRSRGLSPQTALEVALPDVVVDGTEAYVPRSLTAVDKSSDGSSRLATGAARQLQANVTVCLRIVSTFSDAGIGEDRYTETTPTARPAIGNRVLLGGTEYFLGWQTSGRGCFVTNKSSQTLSLEFFARGIIDTHSLRVVDPSNNAGKATKTITTPASGTQWYNIEATDQGNDVDEFSIYAAASLGIAYHRGLGDGSLKIIRNGDPDRSHYSNGVIYLEDDAHEKFTIAHEVGHWILDDSGISPPYDIGGDDNCNGAQGGNGLGRKRYQAVALNEGFATFYAGDAFNSDSASTTPGCLVELAEGVVLSCQTQSTGLPYRVMEQNCSTPFAGFANATDWTRVLWYVHTNGSGDPSMNSILQWIEDADDQTAWSTTGDNAYTLLDARADTIGGAIDYRFDLAKQLFGVDHHP